MRYRWKTKSSNSISPSISTNIYLKFTYLHILIFRFSIGFAVLYISKIMMYDYHYNVMKKHYEDKIKLMYTDTVK